MYIHIPLRHIRDPQAQTRPGPTQRQIRKRSIRSRCFTPALKRNSAGSIMLVLYYWKEGIPFTKETNQAPGVRVTLAVADAGLNVPFASQ